MKSEIKEERLKPTPQKYEKSLKNTINNYMPIIEQYRRNGKFLETYILKLNQEEQRI